MRPFLLKVAVAPEQSFAIRNQVNPLFYNQWHYHAELELTWVQKGAGIRFVGDSIENFQAGDLILLGSNLPHFWRAGDNAETENTCEATVIQFSESFWGADFLNLPELGLIKSLFKQARRGISIKERAQKKIEALIPLLSTAEGLKRILILLEILQEIANIENKSYLSSPGYNVMLNATDTDRIAKIHAFTLANFSNIIMLEDAAAQVHLTPTAFSRYFKMHTRKTYTQFLLEIRVGHACKLLMEGKWSIGQIGLESGFQNTSNFNRYFKAITNLTPLEYLKLHRKHF